MKLRLLLIGLTAFVGTGVFGVSVVEAAASCCVYFQEDTAGGDDCLDLGSNVVVTSIDTSTESCPAGTYSNRLLGAYGFGMDVGYYPPGASVSTVVSLPAEPDSETYLGSSVANGCLDVGPFELDGITMDLEVDTDVDGSAVCGKGLSLMNTNEHSLKLRKKLVETQFEDLQNTLNDISNDDVACCVPIISNSPNQCGQRGINQKLTEQKFSLFVPETAQLNFFYFPPDNELPNFYTCDPNSTVQDWVPYDSVSNSTSINALNGTIKFLTYPESCGAQAGTNYLPPWGYGNTSQPLQQVNAMCNQSSEKYCACNSDNTACKVSYYTSEEACSADVPKEIAVAGGNTVQVTQCVVLDESGGSKTNCNSGVSTEAETSTPSTTEKKTEQDTTEPISALTPMLKALDPLGTSSLQVIFGRLIQIGLGVLGSVALVIFVYGGLLWMTAMGNADRSQKAFSTLLWGTLGIIVILAGYAIVDFVFNSFM